MLSPINDRVSASLFCPFISRAYEALTVPIPSLGLTPLTCTLPNEPVVVAEPLILPSMESLNVTCESIVIGL